MKKITVVLACPDEKCNFESLFEDEIYCGKCTDNKKLLKIKCPACNSLINKRELVTCTYCGESLLVESYDFSNIKNWEGL